LRFTLLMLFFLILGGLLTNTFFAPLTAHWIRLIGFSPNDLWYWQLERLIASALVTSGEATFWQALFFVALFVGLAEWNCGWKRTAAVFWGVHLITLLLLSAIVLVSAAKNPDSGLTSLALARDVGPSAGYFACLGLVSARLKTPWRWLSGAALLAVFVVALILPPEAGESVTLELSADLAHLMAFPLGWLSGLLCQTSHLDPLQTHKIQELR